MTPKLISIIGPTGIGKTALSIHLAKHYNCHIISADSRQFYKELSIGTATPTADELKEAPHHFIKHRSIKESYTVGDFERDAITTITNLHRGHPLVILVGGSGLYVKAVTDGLDDFPEVNTSIRLQLNEKLSRDGLEALQTELKLVDEKAYYNIDLENPHRVIRALEIYLGTGKPYSSFLSNPRKNRDFETIYVGLEADRATVYERINQRVDSMMKAGLLQEAQELLPYRHLNALNTVGYKELFKYLDGEISLELAISEIKKNTRRFAKRQFTWFKKIDNVNWFNYSTDYKEIAQHIDALLKKKSSSN